MSIRIFRTLKVFVLVMTIAFALACGQSTGVPEDVSGAAGDAQGVPFDHASKSPDASVSPPARSAIRLSVGTPILIRLLTPVSSTSSSAGDTFECALDEPIMIEGEAVVPRGGSVTGRVLASKAAGHLHGPGYLRVALVSLEIDGRRVPIETSSLFAKGGAHGRQKSELGESGPGAGMAFVSGKDEVSFAAERRLTFRLAQSVELQ